MQENCRRFTVELHDYSNEELVELFRATESEEYLKELMAKNSGIILTIAKSYYIPAYDLDDLLEVGYIALWNTVKHYDRSRGYAFSSCLKGFVKQSFNRLYNEAHTDKRGGGSEPVSYDVLEDINREQYSNDDHSNLFIEGFIDTLKGTTKKVAEYLITGFNKGDIAKALGCKPSSVSYHINRIREAYVAYAEG